MEPRGKPAPLRERFAPQSFGERYAVGERLGAGGMGEVLHAHDRRIGRDIALKVMHADQAADVEMEARFLREARLQGQLEHPAVVPVYDVGRRPDGSAHFTMKRVAGLTLREVLDRLRTADAEATRRYTRRVLLQALSRVCIAVAYAHDRGVVHRDLKPANVILGDFDEVYVLDWGIARLLGRNEADPGAGVELARDSIPDGDMAQTVAGTLLGTLGYMAPEQLQDPGVDARADVYALGSILFEILTLEPLHRGSPQDMLRSTRNLGRSSVAERAPARDIPPELDGLVLSTTSIDPNERLASARELHDAIEAFLDVERDAERKRQLALHHAEAASLALFEAEPGALEPRLVALRELNAAYTLDPSQGGVLAKLLALLAELPAELPPGVEAELGAQRGAERARSSRRTSLAYVTIAAVLFVCALGATRAPVTLLCIGALSLVTAAHAWFRADARTRLSHFLLSLVLKTLVTASLAVLFGPLVLVPGMVIAVALVVMVHQRARARLRWMVVGVSIAAMLLPLALSELGVLPRFYAFEAGTLRILPWAIELTPIAAYGVLALGALLCLWIPLGLVGRSLEALARAERRFAAQAWYLQRLIAGEKRADSSPHRR